MKKFFWRALFFGLIGCLLGGVITLLFFRDYTLIFNLPRLFLCNSETIGGCWSSSIYSNLIYLMIGGFILGFISFLIYYLIKKDRKSSFVYLAFSLLLFLLFTQISFVSSIKNPAAVYCNEMGYDYIINNTPQGDIGLCFIENDNITLNAWDFFEGKIGVNYSYCKKLGYDVKTLSDGMNPYSIEYAVCITDSNNLAKTKNFKAASDLDLSSESHKIIPLINLMNLTEKVQENNPDVKYSQEPESMITKSSSFQTKQSYNLPSSFDWRSYNGHDWTSPTKDQGLCGTCWAFSAIGTIESNYKIDSGIPDLGIDLSEQYLVDCSGYTCGSGGFTSEALEFVKIQGTTDEACLPYSWTGWFNQQCSERCSGWQNRLTKIYDWGFVSLNDNEIKRQLIERGPLSVNFYADGYWENGIYKCGSNPLKSGHAVVLVGYNDAGGYWIIKNSWGWYSDWLQGTKIGYGECGFGKREVMYVDALAPSDNDGDGFPNNQDSCQNTYGTYCHGCPQPSCPAGYIPNCPSSGQPTCLSSSECISPTNGMTITQNTIFCAGNYSLPNGILINSNNIIIDCNKNKIFGNNNGPTYIPNNYGIKLIANNVTIKNCIISNYTWGIYSSTSDPYYNYFINNTIQYNFYGIETFQKHKIDFNNLAYNTGALYINSLSSDFEIKKNNFYNNSAYNIINLLNAPISATENWWGTKNSTEIDSKISDYYDLPSRGIVTFLPYLNTPVGTLKIICSKNSDCGIEGYKGNLYCSESIVARNYTSFTCNNAGTEVSYCTNYTTRTVNQTCSTACLNGACIVSNKDSDKDGFCYKGYSITNSTLECPNEIGNYGTDCNDNNKNILPPYERMLITNSTILCSGIYTILEGISIKNDNIILDCNKSILKSNITPGFNGVNINHRKNITIKNCILTDYSVGIVLFNSSNSLIINNEVTNNNALGSIGLAIAYNSNKNRIENNLINKAYYGSTISDGSKNNLLVNNSFIQNEVIGIIISLVQDPSVPIDRTIRDNVITQNIFIKNHEGISGGSFSSELIKYNNITKNTFSNQTWRAIILSGQQNNIWDNYFYNNNLVIHSESNNNYCVNGLGNSYFNGATGPNCNIDCTPKLNIIGLTPWENVSCLKTNQMNQTQLMLQYDLNNCGTIENRTFYYSRTREYCDYCDLNPIACLFSLKVNRPTSNGIYAKNQILFDIESTNPLTELKYIDELDKSPKWKNFCKSCSSYLNSKPFREGKHELLIDAVSTEGIITSTNISFFVDTKEPRITLTKPTNKKFTNGTGFYVKFTEINCKYLRLHIKSEGSSVQVSNCDSGVNIEKYLNEDLSELDGKEIQYFFEVEDIANNTDISKITNILVDTTPPKIANLTYSINRKTVYFKMDILNETKDSFNSIEYIDNLNLRPKWKVLCSSLKNNRCDKKVPLSSGDHDITIRATDEAGNSVEQRIPLVRVG